MVCLKLLTRLALMSMAREKFLHEVICMMLMSNVWGRNYRLEVLLTYTYPSRSLKNYFD